MNVSGNHSLDDLTNTVPSAANVYTDLRLTGSGSSFTGSDHYPIVGDYNVVLTSPATPVVISQGFDTNQYYQLTVSSSPTTDFEIQASPDLTTWTNIGSAFTDTNGLLFFTDTNAPSFPSRFYRAHWPVP